MKFTKLIIEGFGSIGNRIEFRLDKQGINLVRGKNGVGKTTIFNALAWCLYGTNLKGLTNGKVPTKKERRPSDFRGTHVSVGIEIDTQVYIVSRHLKYKGLMFGVAGGNSLMVHEKTDQGYKMVTSELFKSDQQAFINRLIGMDYKVFTNSILFGQRMTRLVSASGTEKRAIFEDIFNTAWTSRAREQAKSDYLSIEQLISQANSLVESKTKEKVFFQEQLDRAKKVTSEFESNRTKSIADKQLRHDKYRAYLNELNLDLPNNVDALETLNSDLDKIKVTLDNYDLSTIKDLRARIKVIETATNNCQDVVRKFKSDIDSVRQDIQHLITSQANQSKLRLRKKDDCKAKITEYEKSLREIDTNCTVCNAPIDPSKLAEVENNLGSLLKEQLDLLKELENEPINSHSTEIGELESKRDDLLFELKAKEVELSQYQTKLHDLQQQDKRLSGGVVDLEKTAYRLESDIKMLESSIKTKKSNIGSYQTQIQDIKADIEALRIMTPPSEDFEDIETSIADCVLAISGNSKVISELEVKAAKYEYWYKKGFASTGMSNYIFEVMLTDLNKSIHKYSQRVGLSIEIGIDLTKTSKPLYTKVMQADGLAFDHKELSGGEQQLVDICIAFGTHEMVSKSLPLLILDEVFENLDPNNISKVFDFVRLKVEEGKDVFIITHQADLDFTYTKIIDVVKNGYLTSIE